MIKGFITGSFRPFHLGHEALIDYAKSNCDELTILVTVLPNEVIPYKHRLKWVLSTYLDDPKVTIIADTINEPQITGDHLSIWWGLYIKQKYGKFDRVFTSESYGDLFAESMGAEHWLYDKDRNIIPVSATEIRNKPLSNWEYINNFAKDYFVKKICIVGTESTGKSTLVKHLSSYFETEYCPEVGDEIVEETAQDTNIEVLKEIGIEHAKRILKHTRLSDKLLFVDTDLNITKSYGKFLFNEDLEYPEWVNKANEMDMYIYLHPDTPFIQNGRRLEKEQRNKLAQSHLAQLKKTIPPEKIIEIKYSDFNSWSARTFHIIKLIEKFSNQF